MKQTKTRKIMKSRKGGIMSNKLFTFLEILVVAVICFFLINKYAFSAPKTADINLAQYTGEGGPTSQCKTQLDHAGIDPSFNTIIGDDPNEDFDYFFAYCAACIGVKEGSEKNNPQFVIYLKDTDRDSIPDGCDKKKSDALPKISDWKKECIAGSTYKVIKTENYEYNRCCLPGAEKFCEER